MYIKRINGAKKLIRDNNINALLITDQLNILYLTGFKSLSLTEREVYLFLTDKKYFLFTDARYLNKELKNKLINLEVELILLSGEKSIWENLKKICLKERVKDLGFEAEDLKYLEFQKLSKDLSDIKLHPLNNLLKSLREIKDEDEIDNIRKACEIGDKCLEEIIKEIRPGQKEKEIAFKLEKWVREKNLELAFDPIVAVDKNSAIPHYNTKTGNSIIKNGSLLLIDFGIKYKDYCSDITRMFFIGKKSNLVEDKYYRLLEIQEKTIGKVRAGIKVKDIDIFVRNEFVKENFPLPLHSTGHGLGLEVHEKPRLSIHSEETFKESNVVTVEPGIYYEGKWGMRIEDTVFVGKDKSEILTKFTKKLLVIE